MGVKIKQATTSPLNEVYINGPLSGNANLWIEGLNINNAGYSKSWIKFYGSDNVLSIKGDNKFYMKESTKAIINVGGGLTVEGSGSLDIHVENPDGALIGTDRSEVSSANLTINSGTFIMTAITDRSGGYRGGWGSMIGSGGGGASIGDITVNGGSFDIYTCGAGAPLGGNAGNITIRNANYTAVSDDGACIGSAHSSKVGDILIEDSNINVQSRPVALSATWTATTNSGCGAGIGSGGNLADAGDITIRNSTVNASSNLGAGIGSGYRSNAGNIMLENVGGTITSKEGEDIGKGKLGTIGDITITGSGASGKVSYREVLVEGMPLIIHTGTRANQQMRCYIEDLGLKALGIEDAELITQEKATELLGNPRDPNEIGVLDKAINYALGEATQLGAYMSRLEQTQANLTINQENTTSAESTIRDADMAHEMAAMVKANILTQSSQAMLAQANQVSSNVLDLLG